ncbi:MAG: DNA integrity scanning protein DisA nucleotide-binding domain protein [Deltaproteobacteria bacterium]|nr:DNA integrity scanning protein DisA nucleotide-binding domain protein [Deltaproteobacteria bacterium]
MEIITPIQVELLRSAAAMVAKREFHHLLYIGDLPLPEELVRSKSVARKKLVQAITSETQRQVVQAMGVETLALPIYDIARPERFKIALVSGIAKGLFKDGDVVLGLIGRGPASYPDTLMLVTIGGSDERGSVDTGFGVVGTDRIPSAILESLIDLAVEIGRDGWEGHPIGTLIVVGDTAKVLEKSRQLTLNPFQGYSEAEKNVLNPEVRDAVKNFAVLDGAFVVREDGVVLAAGRYLKFDEGADVKVPLGLGARHMAAAGISQVTNSIAMVVSETSGVTRVFQGGKCVLEIHPEQRSRRAPNPEEPSDGGDKDGPDGREAKDPVPRDARGRDVRLKK